MARLKIPGAQGRTRSKSKCKAESNTTTGDVPQNNKSKDINEAGGSGMCMSLEEFNELFGESSDEEFFGFEPHELTPVANKIKLGKRRRIAKSWISVTPASKHQIISSKNINILHSKTHRKNGNVASLLSRQQTKGTTKDKKNMAAESSEDAEENPYAKKYTSFRRHQHVVDRAEVGKKSKQESPVQVKKMPQEGKGSDSDRLGSSTKTCSQREGNVVVINKETSESKKNGSTISHRTSKENLPLDHIACHSVSLSSSARVCPQEKNSDIISTRKKSINSNGFVAVHRTKEEKKKDMGPSNPYAKCYFTYSERRHDNLEENNMVAIQSSSRHKSVAKRLLMKARKQIPFQKTRVVSSNVQSKFSKSSSEQKQVKQKPEETKQKDQKRPVRLKNVDLDPICDNVPRKCRVKNLTLDEAESHYPRAVFADPSEPVAAVIEPDRDSNKEVVKSSEIETEQPLEEKSLENNTEAESSARQDKLSSLRSRTHKSNPDANGGMTAGWTDDSDDEIPLSQLNDSKESCTDNTKPKVVKLIKKIKCTTKGKGGKKITKVTRKVVKRVVMDTSSKPAEKRQKRVRCQRCKGCQVKKDCKECVFCRDRVSYGGPGNLRKSCVKRQCAKPVFKEELNLSKLKVKGVVSKTAKSKTNVSKRKQLERKKETSSKDPVVKPVSSTTDVEEKKMPGNKKQTLFGQHEELPWKKDKKLELPWPEESEDAAWVSGYHLCAFLPSSTPCSVPCSDLCFLCGSGGFGGMIHCYYCSEAFHTFCLDVDPVNRERWCCDRCKRCTVCGFKQNLLMCDKCHDCYHANCLGPNYHRDTVGDNELWLCGKCVQCSNCGRRTPGKRKSAKWMYDFTMCHECGRLWGKGNYCTICKKCYSEDDFEMEMALCTRCNHWIHKDCEGMNKDEYECLAELPDSVPYICKTCWEDDAVPPWRKEVQEEIQAGFQKICFDMLASRDYRALVKERNANDTVADSESDSSWSKKLFEKLASQQLTCVASFVKEGQLMFDNFKLHCCNGALDIIPLLRTHFVERVKQVFPWFEEKKPLTSQCAVNSCKEEAGISGLLYPDNALLVQHEHSYVYHEPSLLTKETETRDGEKVVTNCKPPADKKDSSVSLQIPKMANIFEVLHSPEKLDNTEKIIELDDKAKQDGGAETGSITEDVPKDSAEQSSVDSENKNHCNTAKDHHEKASITDNPCSATEPRMLSPLKQEDNRRCSLCGLCGHFSEADAGRLLFAGIDDWVHINCALWSAEVYEDKDGQLVNVHTAISRGKFLKCEVCQLYGATVGCCTLRCQKSYHFKCARSIDAVLQDDKKVFCPIHAARSRQDLILSGNDFTVERKVVVELSKAKSHKRLRQGLDPKDVSILCGSMKVCHFGKLTEASDTKQRLYPVGYKVHRLFWSTKDARSRCLYVCSIEKVKVIKSSVSEDVNMGGETICHEVKAPVIRKKPVKATTPTYVNIAPATTTARCVAPTRYVSHPVPQQVASTPVFSVVASPCLSKAGKQPWRPVRPRQPVLPKQTISLPMLPKQSMSPPLLNNVAPAKTDQVQFTLQSSPVYYKPWASEQQSNIRNIFQLLEDDRSPSTTSQQPLTARQLAVTANRMLSSFATAQTTVCRSSPYNVAGSTVPLRPAALPTGQVLVQGNYPAQVTSSFPSRPTTGAVNLVGDPQLLHALLQLQTALLATAQANHVAGQLLAVSLKGLGIDAAVLNHIRVFMAANPEVTRRHLPHLQRMINQQINGDQLMCHEVLPQTNLSTSSNSTPPESGQTHAVPSVNAVTSQPTIVAIANTGTDACAVRIDAAPSSCEPPRKNVVISDSKSAPPAVAKKRLKEPSKDYRRAAKRSKDVDPVEAIVTVKSAGVTKRKNTAQSNQPRSGNLTRLAKKAKRKNANARKRLRANPQSAAAKLKFVIRNEQGWEMEDTSLENVYRKLIQHINEIRLDQKDMPIHITTGKVDALEFFGLSKEPVASIVEQLPGSRHCHKYMFKHHLPTRDDADKALPLNPHGCARAEVAGSSGPPDMFAWLASPHRKLPEPDPEAADDSAMASAQDLPMAMRYRQLKNTARNNVGAYRSPIHGRGLFCKRPIEANDMIIEYSGNVIRKELTDKRELLYEKRGYGCYMFRVDNTDVVDATLYGNAARFINHSCDPNCHSKVITVDGRKKIIIFASRRIQFGEELTYDYKFPIEDEKISCFCGSKKCRKYLN